MAKSIRSKWKRKMRAVKRVRYGQKELERLKVTVGAEDSIKKEIDGVMEDVSEIVTVTTVKSVKDKSKTQPSASKETDDSEEKMDEGTVVHKYSAKTLKDQFGSYPVWMHQRKISKSKKARKGRPKRK